MFPDLDQLRRWSERASLSELSELVRFFESDAARNAVWPEDDTPLGFMAATYLDHFRQRLVDTSRFEQDDLDDIMRHARAHAGGVPVAATTGIAASEGFYQHNGVADLVHLRQAAEMTPWIQVTPKAGSSFDHPRYGKMLFTREGAQEMVGNFREKVYQEHIPIDAEHQTKLSGALGHYRELRVRSDGAVEARIELTDRGRELQKGGGFRYFSPEFFLKWTDPASGKQFKNLLVGGAFTARPFFKDRHLAPLAASEGKVTIWSVGGTSVDEKWRHDDDGNLVLDADGNPQLTDEAAKKVEETSATANTATAEKAVTEFREQNKITDDVVATAVKVEEKEKDKEDKSKTFAEAYPDEAKNLVTMAAENTKLRQSADQRMFTEVVLGRDGQGDGSIPFLGETDKHVTHMQSLSEKFGADSEELEWYVNLNRDYALKAKEMFAEIGSSSKVTVGTSEEDAEKRAKELMKEDSELSFGEAIQKVLEAEPGLYTESLQDS